MFLNELNDVELFTWGYSGIWGHLAVKQWKCMCQQIRPAL